MVLGKWDLRDKGLQSLFQYETKLHFLAELAGTGFLLQDKMEVSKSDFTKFVDDYIRKFGFAGESIKQFVPEIQRAGIIETQEIVSFRHRSFLDYFAALSINKNLLGIENIDEVITKFYFSDLWSDVAFFYVGIENSITKSLINSILNYPNKDFNAVINKLMIGRLLQAGWLSPLEIKIFGIENSLTYMTPARNEILHLSDTSEKTIEPLLAEFFPLIVSDIALGSYTLNTANKKILQQLWGDTNKDSHWKRLTLVWSVWKFLDEAEKSEYLSSLLKTVSDDFELSPAEKGGLLLAMIALDNKDKTIKAAIEKRMQRIINQHKQYFEKLIPPPKDGFRRHKA